MTKTAADTRAQARTRPVTPATPKVGTALTGDWTGGRGIPRSALRLIDRVLDDMVEQTGFEEALEVEFLNFIPNDPKYLQHHPREARYGSPLGDTNYGCSRCSIKIRVLNYLSLQETELVILHELAHVLYRSWSSHDRSFFDVAFSLYGTYGRPEWLEHHITHDCSTSAEAMYVAKTYGLGDMVPAYIVEHHALEKKISRLRSKCSSALYTMEPAARLRFLNRHRGHLDPFTASVNLKYSGYEAISAVLGRFDHDDIGLTDFARLLKVDAKFIPVIEPLYYADDDGCDEDCGYCGDCS
jgi:hypothetical protein